MLPPSQEFWVMCKGIRSSDIDLTNIFGEMLTYALPDLGSRGEVDGHLSLITIISKSTKC